MGFPPVAAHPHVDHQRYTQRQHRLHPGGNPALHLLELALELMRAQEDSQGVPNRERHQELLLFSVSEEYFTIRRRLGINIDA